MAQQQQRLLVIGADGNLGRDLLARLALFETWEVKGCNRQQLDLTQSQAEINRTLETLRPDVIINTAAFTHVDNAESQYDLALQVNATAPQHIAEWVQAHRAYLVHISTDYVFDGEKGALYLPNDQTNPINRYGLSKCLGEQAVINAAPTQSAIVRTSWLFGSRAKNFLPFLVDAARRQTPIRVVTDQWGIPTWTGNVCKMLLELLENKPTGIFHACSTGVTTRYQQAQYVCELLHVDMGFITPVTTDSFEFPAKRPRDTGMLTSFNSAISWQEATQKFLSTQGLLPHHVCS